MKRLRDHLALLASFAFLAFALAAQWGYLAPPIYRDVQVRSVEMVGSLLRLRATYYRTARVCPFLGMEVHGVYFGIPTSLHFEAIRQTNITDQRSVGAQMMELVIETEDRPFDTFEVRTRHECDGEVITKKMLEVNAP